MRRPRSRPSLAAVAVLTVALASCSDSGLSPAAERGRQVYLAQCTSCHASDPAQAGPVGPPVKRSPRDLLEAKVLRGTYPAGYTPKRPTSVMPPQPTIEADIGALAEYLQ
jgi:mono/diheme cytochrome c family protein